MNLHPSSFQQEFYTGYSSVTPNFRSASTDTSSITCPLPPPKRMQAEALLPVNVREEIIVKDSCSGSCAQILRPFSIMLSLEDEGYLATSGISDIYETGETRSKAVTRYLSSLIDELLWFQQKKENLSAHLRKTYQTLQMYVVLV